MIELDARDEPSLAELAEAAVADPAAQRGALAGLGSVLGPRGEGRIDTQLDLRRGEWTPESLSSGATR